MRLGLGQLGDARHHRGHHIGVVDMVRLDEAEPLDGVEPLHADDVGALRQGHRAGVERRAVIERPWIEQGQARAAPASLLVRTPDGRDRVHNQLRPAGAAAAVGDLAGGCNRGRERRGGQRIVDRRVDVIEHRRIDRQTTLPNNPDRTRQAEDCRELLFCEPIGDGAGCRADLPQGKGCDQILDAVGHREDDPVAVANALRKEIARPPVRGGVECGESPRPIAERHGGPVRRHGSLSAQDHAERRAGKRLPAGNINPFLDSDHPACPAACRSVPAP